METTTMKDVFLADLKEVNWFFRTLAHKLSPVMHPTLTKMRNLAIEGLCSTYCLDCQEANDAKKAPLIPEA